MVLNMGSESILVGNLTLSDFAKLEPFGWKVQNPQVLTPYKWEVLDPIAWKDFPKQYQHASFYMGAIYLLTIYSLQRWMKNRPAFDLKNYMFLWNLIFYTVTVFAVFRTVPGFIHVLRQPEGFYRSVCLKEGGDITMGFWTMAYAVSKFVELGDTVFIILRKRPLKFLHWYHHLCTMLVVGVVAPMLEPIVRWYIILNSIAHSFVYPYLALKVIGIKAPSIVAKAITTLQLGEMFAGFFVNMSSIYFLYNGRGCARYPLSIGAFLFVYGTFVILFGKLFYDSILKDKRKDKTV